MSNARMLVNPDKDIPEGITKLTFITNEMVADAPKIANAFMEFEEAYTNRYGEYFYERKSRCVYKNADLKSGGTFHKFLKEICGICPTFLLCIKI